MTTKIDFISDLHIEMWNPTINIKHPCGEKSNHPLDINIFKNSESKILIVAGDTSDTLELSIEKLDEIGKYYDKGGLHISHSSFDHMMIGDALSSCIYVKLT